MVDEKQLYRMQPRDAAIFHLKFAIGLSELDAYDQLLIEDVDAWVGEWVPYAPETMRKVEIVEAAIPYTPDHLYDDFTHQWEYDDYNYTACLYPFRASAYGLVPVFHKDADKFSRTFWMLKNKMGILDTAKVSYDPTREYEIAWTHTLYSKPEYLISPVLAGR